MPKTLAAYAKANPPKRGGRPCWACSLPERSEIDSGRKGGLVLSQIIGWLVNDKGYKPDVATHGRLAAHFDRRHHEQ
jgi:hypothetical protein